MPCFTGTPLGIPSKLPSLSALYIPSKMSDITMREIAKGVWLPTAWPVAGACVWDEAHADGGPCDWPGCECEESAPAHGLSPRPAGGEVEEEAAAAPAAPAKTNWSEWKMVSNTEQPAELYKYAWFTSVRGWRTTQVGKMLVIEVRLFSDNIFRHMIPRIKVRGLIARTHPAARQYNVIVNSYGRHPDLKFKFLDSDNAIEFQMDLCEILYG